MARTDAFAVAGHAVSSALSKTGVTPAQLARLLGVSRSTVLRKLDPENTCACVTLADVVQLAVRGGRLFTAILAELSALDQGPGESRSHPEHVRVALASLGSLAAAPAGGDVPVRARRWAELEATARQAQRDLRAEGRR